MGTNSLTQSNRLIPCPNNVINIVTGQIDFSFHYCHGQTDFGFRLILLKSIVVSVINVWIYLLHPAMINFEYAWGIFMLPTTNSCSDWDALGLGIG